MLLLTSLIEYIFTIFRRNISVQNFSNPSNMLSYFYYIDNKQYNLKDKKPVGLLCILLSWSIETILSEAITSCRTYKDMSKWFFQTLEECYGP